MKVANATMRASFLIIGMTTSPGESYCQVMTGESWEAARPGDWLQDVVTNVCKRKFLLYQCCSDRDLAPCQNCRLEGDWRLFRFGATRDQNPMVGGSSEISAHAIFLWHKYGQKRSYGRLKINACALLLIPTPDNIFVRRHLCTIPKATF